MACVVVGGPVVMDGEEDEEGHRTYKISFNVKGDLGDGPPEALQAAGLPTPGSLWQIKVLNNITVTSQDVFAWFRRNKKVKALQEKEGDRVRRWRVDMEASTKPLKRCADQRFEDPLSEPPKISIKYNKKQEEATEDRFGDKTVTSSFEQIRGPQNEWDKSIAVVSIKQNVLNLDLELWDPMVDTLNDATLWGAPPRCVKLSNPSMEQNFYGTCNSYWTRSFEFEVNIVRDPDTGLMKSGWDRDVLDEGTKALHGEWRTTKDPVDPRSYWAITPVDYWRDLDNNPDYTLPIWPDCNNPAHFIRFGDKKSNTARVILDGCGRPWDPDEWEAVHWWWVQSAGFAGFEVHGTCADAFYWATSVTDGLVYGPYDTGAEAVAGQMNGAALVCCCPTKDPGRIHLEKYGESNFLLLGLPTVLA